MNNSYKPEVVPTLILGESPGLNPSRFPLSPDIRGSAGERLWKISGLSREDYEDLFQRHNLLYEYPGKKWPIKEARYLASEFVISIKMRPRNVFLLGRKVADAFGLMHQEFYQPFDLYGAKIYVLPHPSGLNRWYNDKENQKISRHFWFTYVNDVLGIKNICRTYTL